jgi:hypothetical protein
MDDTRNDIREEANRVDNQATQYRKLATGLAEVATVVEDEVLPNSTKHEINVKSRSAGRRKIVVASAWYDDYMDVPAPLIAGDKWTEAKVATTNKGQYRLRLAAECGSR